METTIINTLKLKDISFGYEKKRLIIDNLSYEFVGGKVYALLGAMASGKSTLLKLIARLLKPMSGKIVFNDIDIDSMTEIQLRKQVGIAFQYPDRSIFALSVFEEIAFALKMLYPEKKDEFRDRVIKAMAIVGLDESFIERNPHFLSGGEKRKVSLAASLVHEPSVLLLDEPTAGLDGISAKQILSFFSSYAQKGKIVLFTTHHLEDTCYADETLIMFEGKLHQVEPTDVQTMLKFGLMPPEYVLYHRWGRFYGFEK